MHDEFFQTKSQVMMNTIVKRLLMINWRMPIFFTDQPEMPHENRNSGHCQKENKDGFLQD